MDWTAAADWIIQNGPELLLLGEIVGVFVCSLFSRYKEAMVLTFSAAVTLLLGW